MRISLAGRDVPELDQPVVARGSECRAVGRESDGVDAIGVAGDGRGSRLRGDVPDLDFAFARGESTGRGEALAVVWRRQVRGPHRHDPTRVATGLRRGIDQPDLFIAAERDHRAIGPPCERVDLRLRIAGNAEQDARRLSVAEQKLLAGEHGPDHIFERLPVRIGALRSPSPFRATPSIVWRSASLGYRLNAERNMYSRCGGPRIRAS